MKTLQYISALICIGIFFTACASKDMKKFGGEVALANQSGEPISTIVTLTVGGAIYGIGALTEDKEEQKRLEKIKNLPRTYHDDNVVKGAPVTYDNTIIVSDVVISDSKIADTNTTSSQKE